MPAALCQHPKHQATFNVVTSGEYSHLTLKRQLSVNTALLSPFIQQPDAPAGPHQAHPLTVFPGGEDGYSGSDLHRGGSQSYDSCYLPVGEMPSFAFEAGDTDMPQQQGLWESGPDAQIAHAQASIHVQSAANDALGAHSKPQDWCSIMPHSLALSSEAPPCVPDLLPLPPSDPPPPCSSWDHQAWQASWQHHQHQPQHQPQQHLTCSVAQPSVQVATCPEGTTAAVGLEFEPAASGCDPNAAWWLLPSCSVENLLQADSLFATGG